MLIFTNMIEDFMEVFMDDFSVYGSSFKDCLENLCLVLKRCEEKNLVLNWEKCHFMVRDGIVLGHRVSEAGIEVDCAKIEVMMSLQPPNCVKGVRSFLGHAGFYRRFIKDFSKIARPLTSLLCKDAKFEFTPDYLAAFEHIKKPLISTPVVQPPDWDLPFEKKDVKPQLLRWILLLQEFDIEVGDKKDVENGVADHFSSIKVDDDIPIDDFLLEENVYYVETRISNSDTTKDEPVGICVDRHNQDASVDADAGFHELVSGARVDRCTPSVSIDAGKIYRQAPSFIPTVRHVECMRIGSTPNTPWYADIANYLAADVQPNHLKQYAKKRFFRELRRYFWDEPYLYKHCSDGMYRRSVAETEVAEILFHCHGSEYAGHFATFKTVAKVLQAGFWWPTMFHDAHAFIARCDVCQRRGKISKRNEMPQNFILEVEVFD
ncbi:putative mitochondrial protein [Cardamine amara subsp. amara]|uniref:Mitochondrial protein n=1 Tax=Cardamine amara subsp. amara TaxID=228776 RepID=A0ABD0ZYF4_CARAN